MIAASLNIHLNGGDMASEQSDFHHFGLEEFNSGISHLTIFLYVQTSLKPTVCLGMHLCLGKLLGLINYVGVCCFYFSSQCFSS